jgi:HD-like signal output (HDOD) protein/ActR/RegA family two-component response regulator
MKSVFAIFNESEETGLLKETIAREFSINVITSFNDLNDTKLNEADIALIDQDISQPPVRDILKRILETSYLPVILLANSDNAIGAIDAIRDGAYNYLIKTKDCHQIINLVIKDAINKSSEKAEMRQTIVDLKKRVGELEEKLSKAGIKDTMVSSAENTKGGIIDDVVDSLKRGEINLPSLPKIEIEFKKLMDKGGDFQEVADLLKQDMAISSKLISVSNSAYYRGMTPNKTTEQAVGRLGLNLTRQYVDAIFNRSLYATSNKKYVDVIERLWKHAFSCAFTCQCVTEALDLTLKDDAFSIGLFHDIGKLFLIQIISEMEAKGKFSEEIDMEDLINTLSAHHGSFGSSLLKRWGFSEQCVQAARYCDDIKAADPISKELIVVHFSNVLVGTMGYDFEDPEKIDLESVESTHLLGLDSSAISEIRNKVKGYVEGELIDCL